MAATQLHLLLTLPHCLADGLLLRGLFRRRTRRTGRLEAESQLADVCLEGGSPEESLVGWYVDVGEVVVEGSLTDAAVAVGARRAGHKLSQ